MTLVASTLPEDMPQVEKCQKMSKNVEKCCVLSNFVEVTAGGTSTGFWPNCFHSNGSERVKILYQNLVAILLDRVHFYTLPLCKNKKTGFL